MSGRVMPVAYATGICATYVRAADARTYGRTYGDNYSPCEDILLLSNAREDKPIQVSLSVSVSLARAKCPVCGHECAIRRDGGVYQHLQRSRYGRHLTSRTCPGSGQSPRGATA